MKVGDRLAANNYVCSCGLIRFPEGVADDGYLLGLDIP